MESLQVMASLLTRIQPSGHPVIRSSSHLVIVLCIFLLAPGAHAASLIRDAEIEHTLRTFADPLFRQAGLNPDNVNIFIVQDSAINAYVAGGANIFLHTGLLEEMENPGMLLGVIAHETGHIAGGHLARGTEQLRNAQLGMILGYVLGAAAGVAGGGDAGMAIISGSQNLLHRSMLSFTRANEQAADQSALNTLEALNVSSSGMISVFELLRRNELRRGGAPDPYALTHPLSRERIEHVRSHVEKSRVAEGAYPRSYDALHQRMRAKLYAFLELPPKTFARYPASDRSVPARMARAVAWYKIPELDKALAEVNALIHDDPNDPFLYDLKGQIQFENGRIREALATYAKAVSLKPNAPLLRVALAEARIATDDESEMRKAVDDLSDATHRDRSHARAWRLMATAQGRLGNQGMSHLALAEEAALQGDAETVQRQAESALSLLPENSPARLRAEDLKRLAADMKETQEDAQ